MEGSDEFVRTQWPIAKSMAAWGDLFAISYRSLDKLGQITVYFFLGHQFRLFRNQNTLYNVLHILLEQMHVEEKSVR